jgi:hypothetical protein
LRGRGSVFRHVYKRCIITTTTIAPIIITVFNGGGLREGRERELEGGTKRRGRERGKRKDGNATRIPSTP